MKRKSTKSSNFERKKANAVRESNFESKNAAGSEQVAAVRGCRRATARKSGSGVSGFISRTGNKIGGLAVDAQESKQFNTVMRACLSSGLVFLLAFTVAGLATSIFMPVSETNAETVALNIDPEAYATSVTSTTGTLETTVSTNLSGATVVLGDTLNVKTSSPNGYKLYLSTNSSEAGGDRMYRGGNASSDYISASTGTFNSPKKLSEMEANTWGFAIKGNLDGATENSFKNTYDPDNPQDDDTFAPVPKKGQEQLLQTKAGATGSSGNNVDIYYAVKANNAIPSGRYQATVVYSAVTDATSVSGGEAAVAPTVVDNDVDPNPELTITTSLYTTMDPGTVTVTVDGTDCPVTSTSTSTGVLVVKCTAPSKSQGTYNAVVTVSKFNKSYTTSLTYTAATPTFYTAQYMQDMTSDVCASATTPTTSATAVTTTASDNTSLVPQTELTDKRDNRVYTVRKLADGNCWMVENLALDLSTSTPLTTELSDIHADPQNASVTRKSGETGITGGTNGIYSWTPGANTMTAAGTADGGANSSVGMNFTRSLNQDKDKFVSDTVSGAQTSYTPSGSIKFDNTETHRIGNYYNWYTATASTGTYDMTSGKVATSSICPAGWMLPSGSDSTAASTKGWHSLFNGTYGLTVNTSNAASSTSAREQLPLSLHFTGYFFLDGSVYSQGSGGGGWWSSMAVNNGNAYNSYVDSSSLYSRGSNNKRAARTIRCVAR